MSVSLRLVYEHKALAWDARIVYQMPNYHYQKEMKEKMNLCVDFFLDLIIFKCMSILPAWICGMYYIMFISGAHDGPKAESNPMELEL